MTVANDLPTAYVVTAAGCWEWTRSLNSRGYGLVSVGGSLKLAHRHSYETHVGPIPDGLQIDHLCRNKACVNPAHLEPVTSSENTQRRPDVHKTHCKHGHAMTPENTQIKRRPNGMTIRNCRTCHRAQQRLAYLRKRLVSGHSGVIMRLTLDAP